jgi:hypothetical protein
VTLETSLVISDLQRGNGRIFRVSVDMTILTRCKIINNRFFKDIRRDIVAFLAREGTTIAMLVVTGPAITRDSGVSLVIEPHCFIHIRYAVQGHNSWIFLFTRRYAREKAKTY